MVATAEFCGPLRRTLPELNMLIVATALNRLSDLTALTVYPPPPQMPSAPSLLASTPALLPLITREIIYRLLVGEQGAQLRHLATLGGYMSQVARAIERLRHEFDQPLRVEQLARELGMSVSGLHHQFKAVTALSPVQFQKRLRLLEARRVLLDESLDAAHAAFHVGYLNTAHFNREYKRLFGPPPMRDVQRLREVARANASR
jgi:AraC-like DNA-binding protein